MFAIYNNGSVQFRSTSDNLYTLDKVDEAAQSRLKPDDELYQYLGEKNKEQKYTQQAIDTYKKIANLDTNEIVYHVEEIMTHKCVTIDKSKSVQNAFEVLKQNHITQIPIVTESNKIVSLISKKIILNLLMEDISNYQLILNKQLESLSLPEFITTDPISDIRRVAKVMVEKKLDAIPVVEHNDLLVGIVSKTDIIRAMSHIPSFKLWA